VSKTIHDFAASFGVMAGVVIRSTRAWIVRS
jgi:hypothetical protein